LGFLLSKSSKVILCPFGKFLFIANNSDDENLKTHDEEKFFQHILERIDLSRDIHFQTKTTIDTLDYSGDGLNTGSKVIIAACGEKKRELINELPNDFVLPSAFKNPRFVTNGILAVEMVDGQRLMDNGQWTKVNGLPLIVICDDADFLAADFNNFLWVTFTRSNPSHDIYGINERYENKHWCCDTLIIDARIKPHHAPVLEKNALVEKRVDEILKKYL